MDLVNQDSILKELREADWCDGAALVDSEGLVVVDCDTNISKEESSALTEKFRGREYAVAEGVTVGGTKYAVHRYYEEENMIYGRCPEPAESGDGFVVLRLAHNESQYYLFVTYKLPTVSPRAIRAAQSFVQTSLRPFLSAK